MPSNDDWDTDWCVGETCGVGDQVVTRDLVVHQVHRAWSHNGLTECMIWVVWIPRRDLRPPLQNCNQQFEPVMRITNSTRAVTCMVCIAERCEDL